MEHRDGDRAPTAAEGTFHLDTRTPVTRVAADLLLNPLSPAGLAATFPQLEGQLPLTGRLWVEGPTDSLVLDADLRVPSVTFRPAVCSGSMGRCRSPRGLLLVFDSFDLNAIDSAAPTTRLRGSLLVDGRGRYHWVPRGDLVVSLGPGSFAKCRSTRPRRTSGSRVACWSSTAPRSVGPGVGPAPTARSGGRRPTRGRCASGLNPTASRSLDSLVRVASGWTSDTLLQRALSGRLWVGRAALRCARPSSSGVDRRRRLPRARWLGAAEERGRPDLGDGPDPRIDLRLVADSIRRGEVRFHAIRAAAQRPARLPCVVGWPPGWLHGGRDRRRAMDLGRGPTGRDRHRLPRSRAQHLEPPRARNGHLRGFGRQCRVAGGGGGRRVGPARADG